MLKVIVLLIVPFVFFASSYVRAQRSSGTYIMFASGNRVSTESYTIDTTLEGTLRAEGEINSSGSTRRTTTLFSKGKLTSFTAQVGEVKLISAVFTGSRANLQISGQAEQQIPTRATVILENMVWHHYDLLLNQYDSQKGGLQNFTVFLPSQAREFEAQVEHTNSATYELSGRQVSTEHYRLASHSGPVVDIWTDQSRVPLLISIEAQGIKVVRQGWEQLAEIILRSPAQALYLSEEVTFQNGEVTLSGTLTLPKSNAAPYPAALLISGSGPQNRDGNPGTQSLYRYIGEYLSSKGIAVLRHDDRGVGKSLVPKTPSTYRDLINDSKAAIDYLRVRKEIDPRQIVLIGHSEGGTTATIIASEDVKIAGVVLLAGAVLDTIDQLLIEQTIYQKALEAPFNPQDEKKYPQIAQQLLKQIEDAKSGKPDATPTDVGEYLRQHMALNRLAIYKRIRCPVLILQGERDALVLSYHAVAAARALTESGNKQVTLRIFPNLSHSFMPAPLDQSTTVEKRQRVSTEVLETIQKWTEGISASGSGSPVSK